jgi:hypothetical protein
VRACVPACLFGDINNRSAWRDDGKACILRALLYMSSSNQDWSIVYIYMSLFRITCRYISYTSHTHIGRPIIYYIIGACACMLGGRMFVRALQRSTCMHAPADKHSGSASSLSLLISVHLRPRVVLASRRIN